MAFAYHWYRKEANFGPVVETETSGGTQTIHSEGHFGQVAYNEPYPEFSLMERLIA